MEKVRSEKHPFQPFLPAGARILFLGSFPPQPHRWCMPFYYPNWINDFWRILGLIFFDDKNRFCRVPEKRFDEVAIRQFCADEGLAFYDTACEVRRLRDNASDAFLEVVRATDVPALLRQIPSCHTIVTTGQKATEVIAETFGCEVPPIGGCIQIKIPGQARNDMEGTVRNDMEGTVRNDGEGKVCDGVEGTVGMRTVTFWRMPSTSRAYPLPLERKADAYRRLFQ